MLIRTSLVAVVLGLVAQASRSALADDVRYFNGEDGLTYRETRQVIHHTVPETRIEQRESVTYQPKYTSQLQETQRTYMAPTTEYQWVPYMERSWNPFAAPVLTYRLVPQTRWDQRIETVRIPVTLCEMVPEKHVVQVPVTTSRVAQGEIVTRVPVATSSTLNPTATPTATQAASPVARAERVGGLHNLSSGDPPRQSSNSGAAGGAVQR